MLFFFGNGFIQQGRVQQTELTFFSPEELVGVFVIFGIVSASKFALFVTAVFDACGEIAFNCALHVIFSSLRVSRK